jgi:cell division protein FtsZ
MQDAGEALMGIGWGTGDNRAEDAAKQAVSSPLLETSIDGARGILFNITAGKDITLHEIKKAAEIVKASADASANIIFGVCNDDRMQDEVKITVIATGFGQRLSHRVDFEPTVQAEPVSRPSEMPRPELGEEELDDINIPAFLRNRV